MCDLEPFSEIRPHILDTIEYLGCNDKGGYNMHSFQSVCRFQLLRNHLDDKSL